MMEEFRENEEHLQKAQSSSETDSFEEQQPVLRFAKILPLTSPFVKEVPDLPESAYPQPQELLLHLRGKHDTTQLPKEKKPLSSAPALNLTKAQLEILPVYTHVDRNSRVLRQVTADTVAACLLNYLRLNSIQVKYEDDDPGKFNCKSFDFVSFRINMFSSNRDTDEIIVEVQRRSGCSLSFQKIRRALLSTVDGLASGHEMRRSSISHETRCVDASCLNCHDILAADNPKEDCATVVAKALEEIRSQLNSERSDAQILALEQMTQLTNPMYTPSTIVQAAAVSLLQSDDICQSVRNLILEGKIRAKAIEDLDMDLQYEDDFVDHSRQLALVTYLNCFQALSHQLTSFLSVAGEKMTEKVLPCLLNNVRGVNDNAHIALLSMKCISILSMHSHQSRDYMLENGIKETLNDAVQYGASWNEDIRREAESLFMKFSCM